MNAIPPNFSCERCGREAGDIFSCPERARGNCTFVEQWKRRKITTLEVGGIIGSLLGVVFLSMWVLQVFKRVLPFFNLPLVLIVIPIGLWAVYLALSLLALEVQLYNPHSGVRLQRTTLMGIELSRQWTATGSLLPIHLTPSQPLAYPFSITALPPALPPSNSIHAAAVFRAALINLLVKKHIEIYPFQSYGFRKWWPSPFIVNDYIIVATQNRARAQDMGVLEDGILQALKDWPLNARAKEWASGPPIYDLVRAVFESDKSSVTTWLFERVMRDATVRASGQLKGTWSFGFTKNVELDVAHAAAFQKEQQIVQALSEHLTQTYPEFSHALDAQILKAINAREPSD